MKMVFGLLGVMLIGGIAAAGGGILVEVLRVLHDEGRKEAMKHRGFAANIRQLLH